MNLYINRAAKFNAMAMVNERGVLLCWNILIFGDYRLFYNKEPSDVYPYTA